jgi:GNAT superfamily N-acetyltransferase
MSVVDHIKSGAELLRQGRVRTAWEGMRPHFYSDTLAYGLRRDLSIPFASPPAKIPTTVRPLAESEIALFRDADPDLSESEAFDRRSRLPMLEQKIGTCYAAADAQNHVCYVQWLFLPKDNPFIASHFRGLFPQLGLDYALLEGALTFREFRGLGVMQAAMAQIAEKAAEHGARYVITFVTHDNIPSLKGCKRAGFYPYCERIERRRMLRASISFRPLPAGTPYSFDAAQQPKGEKDQRATAVGAHP